MDDRQDSFPHERKAPIEKKAGLFADDRGQDPEKILQMYDAAMKLAKLSVWIYEIRKHRIVLSNSGITQTDCREYSIPAIIENVPDSLAAWVDGGELQKLNELYKAIDSGAPEASCEYWYKKLPGTHPRCEKILYTTVFDDEGKPVYAYGIGQNITAQKLEEEKYDRMYRQAARANPFSLGTFRLNLTKNTCTDGQSPYPAVLLQQQSGTADGYFEANGRTITDPEIAGAFRRIFTRERLLEAFSEGNSELSIEFPVQSSKGGITWVDGFINMVQNPSTGDVEAMTYALDITERKIEENIVNRLIEEKYDHIGLIDPEARTFELWSRAGAPHNSAFRAKISYENFQQEMAQNKVVPEDRELFMRYSSLETLTSQMMAGKDSTFAYRTLQDDGRIHRKQVQYLWLDSSKHLIINIQSDITAVYEQEQEQLRKTQNALRAARDANAAKTDFLSRMSHDIRTPLNGIIGMTRIAEEQSNPEKTVDCLSKIGTSSKFLLGLVNDVLDMAKAESGKIELHPEPYPIEEFSGYINAVIKPLCDGKNQSLVFNIRGIKEIIAIIDILRINQIYFNLLSNAVKYTPEGGTITVSVKEELVPGHKDRITTTVADNGIGMSEQFQRVLFEPFTQENRSDISEMRGSGLGLSIVKRIVSAMNGTISVQSSIGKGSVFTFVIEHDYIEESEFREKHEKNKGARPDESQLKGRHILLCEDHPLNQEIAKTLLEGKGMIVEIAENGQEAVKRFNESMTGFYDVILMDIRMPIMDGYEATRQIRALKRQDAGKIPIIAMTADAFADDIAKCHEAGMCAHISKPIDPALMNHTILEALTANSTDKGRCRK